MKLMLLLCLLLSAIEAHFCTIFSWIVLVTQENKCSFYPNFQRENTGKLQNFPDISGWEARKAGINIEEWFITLT